MRINIISESVFSPKQFGGIHTAFFNNVKMLKHQSGITVLVNSLRKSDITHIHSLGPLGLFMLLFRKPSVVTSHVLPETFIGSYKGGRLMQGVIRSYLRFIYSRATFVIALTQKAKKALQTIGVTTTIVLLPNSIDTAFFRKDFSLREKGRKKYQVKTKQFVVICVGNTILRKGIEDFVILAERFPAIIFMWVGDKPFLKALSATTGKKEAFLDNLRFVGQVSYVEMPLLYNIADVFLSPSYQEIAPMAILEAAACGLPLILRDLSEYRELYIDGYIACANNDEFSIAIEKMYKNKTAYAAKIADSKKLAAKFDDAIIGNKMIEYYQSLLQQ